MSEHNHLISKAAYDEYTVQLNEKEKEVVADLRDANCKVSQICRVLHSKFDKKLSTQKVRNILQKLNSGNDDNTLQLQNFLEEVEEEGGTVNVEYDSDGNVSSLFLTSVSMKAAYLQSACTLVQIDTSFNVDTSKYKLCAFCYLNPTTNRSEICALGFLSTETAENFGQVFLHFKKMSPQSPEVFLVDKDFNEIAVPQEVFKTSIILLCNFHVIKYVKKLVATALITVEQKNEIMKEFKVMMYSRTFIVIVTS